MNTTTNTQTQHTPGPWTHEGTTRFCVTTDHDNPAHANERHLACVGRYPGMTDAEYRANARLIASAPELLSALKSLLPLAIHTSPEDVSVHQARAAIAKATGPTGGASDLLGTDWDAVAARVTQ